MARIGIGGGIARARAVQPLHEGGAHGGIGLGFGMRRHFSGRDAAQDLFPFLGMGTGPQVFRLEMVDGQVRDHVEVVVAARAVLIEHRLDHFGLRQCRGGMRRCRTSRVRTAVLRSIDRGSRDQRAGCQHATADGKTPFQAHGIVRPRSPVRHHFAGDLPCPCKAQGTVGPFDYRLAGVASIANIRVTCADNSHALRNCDGFGAAQRLGRFSEAAESEPKA